MSDPLEYQMDFEYDLGITFLKAEESNRIGIGNLNLIVDLERVKEMPNTYVNGYQETVNGLELRVEEKYLSIRFNYSQFMEGLTLPTESAESWKEFRSKLYESLKVARVILQNYNWLEVREITFYSRIGMEKNFEVYSQVIGLMSLFGRGVEFQNGSFVYDSKLFSLRIGPVKENFKSELNVSNLNFFFSPEKTLLLEFSIQDQEAFIEIFNRSICLQELESRNVVKFYSNVLKNLSESIKRLVLQDRLFKFFDVILSFKEDKSAFKDELSKIAQLLLVGDHKTKDDWFGKDSLNQLDAYYGSVLEIQGAIFESESSLEQIRSSLKEKNYLVEELYEKLRGGVFIS
ncbi:hypothetical protein [Leptospira interrogans]|uniref:hypothetical protein n=1 Tax=Leptospira interrogans TaxID=173 RepID=UPI0002BBA512|nr:hypothetical protein [Leptospira interrogans]EMN80303.1 hypothetical protein LEP1GSC106_2537 [Leptospira interrogans serovar Grippotyphosa str. UI 12764]